MHLEETECQLQVVNTFSDCVKWHLSHFYHVVAEGTNCWLYTLLSFILNQRCSFFLRARLKVLSDHVFFFFFSSVVPRNVGHLMFPPSKHPVSSQRVDLKRLHPPPPSPVCAPAKDLHLLPRPSSSSSSSSSFSCASTITTTSPSLQPSLGCLPCAVAACHSTPTITWSPSSSPSLGKRCRATPCLADSPALFVCLFVLFVNVLWTLLPVGSFGGLQLILQNLQWCEAAPMDLRIKMSEVGRMLDFCWISSKNVYITYYSIFNNMF